VGAAGETLDVRLARLGPERRALLEARLRSAPSSGHRLVATALKDLGVTHVYGVPGQPVYDTFAACIDAGLRTIGTRHQQPAALMAVAHNYLAGRQTAVTIVSAGVPATNALGAVVTARDNAWPLIVLAGTAPLEAEGAGYFMALDAVELYRSVTKRAIKVVKACDIAESIAQAFETSMHGRPGPVLVQLPEDVLTGLARNGSAAASSPSRLAIPADFAATQQAAGLLLGARRPLLIIGKGVRWAAPYPDLRQLVDRLAIPFITSPIGCGAIPDGHPLCMNAVPWIAQAGADLVMVLGARLDWTFRYGTQLSDDAKVIQVDLHAPEFGRGRAIALGIRADVGSFLRVLLTESDVGRQYGTPTTRDPAWLPGLSESAARARARWEAPLAGDGFPISPLRLAREIRDALPRDAITIFDGNLVMAACQRVIPAHAPASRLTPGTSGGLGVGIPYALAAKLEHPGRPVVAICGDFAFGISAIELETAVRHQIAIVVIVANNDGNAGSLRHRMHRSSGGGEPVTMFRPGLRYDRIGEIFGSHAEHVDRAGDIGPALKRAIACGRPACINVAVDPDAVYPAD
jgi:2-hydroxyacyl-CoA lyase 1